MILVSSSFAVAIAANNTKYSNYSSFLTLLLCWCWVVRMLMALLLVMLLVLVVYPARSSPFDLVDDSMQ